MKDTVMKLAATVIEILTIIFIICLAINVFCDLGVQIENYMQMCNEYGYNYYLAEDYEDAKESLDVALFMEKYIVFWNGNKELPIIYRNQALTLSGEKNYEEAARKFEEALTACESYLPEQKAVMASLHMQTALVYFMLGNDDMMEKHVEVSEDFYGALPSKNQDFATGIVFLEIAHLKYSVCDYEDAAMYFERGLPLVYEDIYWGPGNELQVKELVASYKMMADACERTGKEDAHQSYGEKYRYFCWIRDYSEDEIDTFIDAYE